MENCRPPNSLSRKKRDFLGSGGQARTVSQVGITTVSGPQLTMSFEVAAEQHADVDARTVRAVHQTDLPGTMSFEVAAEQHADVDARTVRAVHQTDLPG